MRNLRELLQRVDIASLVQLTFILAAIVGTALHFWPVFTHQGLPGGDSAITVLWSRIIERDQSLPDYGAISRLWLTDTSIWNLYGTYLTPLLHSSFYLLTAVSGVSDLALVAIFAVLTWIGILILLYRIVRRAGRFEALAAVALISLGGLRTYRYFFETGFHFQNLVGDMVILLFLFAALLILGSDRDSKWRRYLLLLAVAPFVTFFFHQLSAAVLLLTLILLLPVALFEIRIPKESIIRRKNLLIALALMISGAVLLVFVFNTPFIADMVQNLTSATDVEPAAVSPWALYGTLLGPLLWYLGLAGTGIMIGALILDWTQRRRGLGRIEIGRRTRDLSLLGVAWLSATLLLSRTPELGLNLPGTRFLWYATYPLAMNAVLGLAFLRYYWPKSKASPSAHDKRHLNIPIAILILSAAFLSIPYAESFVYVQPPGVSPSDTTYNGETAAVADFLRAWSEEPNTIWIDFAGWKSLIWLWPELVPYANVSIRFLPGSSFSAPLSAESIEAFLRSPEGSIIVKGSQKNYPYFNSACECTYALIATTPNLVVLEKVIENSPIPAPVELMPSPIQSPHTANAAFVVILMIAPGFLISASFARGKGSANQDRLHYVWLSVPLSLLILGVTAALFLLGGIGNQWIILTAVFLIIAFVAFSGPILNKGRS